LNCLQIRRELLAAPRESTARHAAHLSECPDCAGLAARIDELDRGIHDAALVPPPDGLAHRILLQRTAGSKWRFAAVLALGLTMAVGLVLLSVIDLFDVAGTAEAVGPAHPGVAAIALVADEEPNTADAGTAGNAAEVASSLKRLGLTLTEAGGTTYYVGKCHMAGGRCDHLLLSTPEGHANVLLLADYPVGRRVLVADRHMTALVNPAPHGGYIVVTESPKLAKRTGRRFRAG